ncbi:MAG: flagellar basal body rod protein FlgC [Betaproteobacteria bacterium]|jgi:flagellar basal-body rod protein FlgC|nr:flagellar basal body rod protein FlgC [Polynucleobacter sp.]MCF8196230.1 flagellar basal body rod protein FlgC [Polynucleobacter sp.]NBY63872.1 flagellar basal body rod protein FlgC [Betaproteobacteria bacterium]
MSLLNTFNIGASGMSAQSIRLNTISSNIANAESSSGPDGRTYRARQVVFSSVPSANNPGSGVAVTNVVESNAPLRREFRPGHPKADNNGYVDMPNVNPVEEMVDMISASRAYQTNVQMVNVTRQLVLATLDLGK